MRKLGLDDVFYMSSIIDALELKDFDLESAITAAFKSEDAVKYLGGQMVLQLMSNFHKAKNEIYEWLIDLTGKTQEDIKALSFKELKQLFTDIFSGEDVESFLDLLSASE